MKRRHIITAAACTVFSVRVGAQSSTSVRIIVPASAGSGQDTTLRAAQQALASQLNQPVVIENISGAGGLVGIAQLLRAKPDGKTLGLISNNYAVAPGIYKKMPYDSVNDFTPICVIGETPLVIVVNPRKLPVSSATELQAALRANPDGYNYASSGNGTVIQLAMEMYLDAAGVRAKHIPYKGMSPALSDIVGGQVDLGVVGINIAQPYMKSGSLHAVAAMGGARVPSWPDLPTLKEQGFPQVEVAAWFAMIGPKGMPPDEVRRVHAAVVAAWNAPEVKEAMAKQDNVVNPSSPEAAGRFIKAEIQRYARIAEKAKISAD